MSLLVLLIVLLVLFGGGGWSYSRWGRSGPAWGGNVLWLLFAIVLILILLDMAGVRPWRY